jgi:TatD DNase family protein
MQLIDTHAHLDYPEFDADRDEVVRRAAESGVTRIITVGTNIDSSRRAIWLAEKYEGVFASVGVHPNDCAAAADDAVERLRELAQHPKVVAIGETGLDYHYLPSRKDRGSQREAAENPTPHVVGYDDDASHKLRQALFFRGQLELARELGKPVIIHQRDSFEDVAAVIEDFQKQGGEQKVRGVFHCFGEDCTRAERVLALGFNISFTGILTFKNAAALREVAARLPLGRVMVETDCPFLAPQPFRGKRCEPAHIKLTAQQLADAKGVSLDEIACVTTATARDFFGI